MNDERKYGRPDLVNAWLKGEAWTRDVEWKMDAEEKWVFIKALVDAALNDTELASIGAGPLEDLLYGGSEDFIDRVEAEAKVNQKFKYSLSIVRNPNMVLKNPSRKDEIQARIDLAIRKET